MRLRYVFTGPLDKDTTASKPAKALSLKRQLEILGVMTEGARPFPWPYLLWLPTPTPIHTDLKSYLTWCKAQEAHTLQAWHLPPNPSLLDPACFVSVRCKMEGKSLLQEALPTSLGRAGTPTLLKSSSIIASTFWSFPLYWIRGGLRTGSNAPSGPGFTSVNCLGSHSLLQGIFPTQGSNLGLLHCRQILYHLSHLASPVSW